ncbi:hypothetical protein C5167_025568 [Papaver somniferum]|uniref:BAG domain-containing protein n=1 Tax=Papaver somniferum TaxID=3469 RepID=A0A4Y7JVR9_PAPSO|nr:BAG family molecular chaperone regulator 7-like [Papaver somniferum]RZC63819.1 hypothetical protein C5167_025568 [Papaver somniferum]
MTGGCRRKIEIYESSPSFFIKETSIFKPNPFSFPSFEDDEEFLGFNLKPDLCLFNSPPPQCLFTPFDFFDNVADLIQIEKTPFQSTYKRIRQRSAGGNDAYIKSLCDRVAALETGLDRVSKEKKMMKTKKKNNVKPPPPQQQDRKYSWTAEIKTDDKDGVDRKYKWSAEIKSGEDEDDVQKNYKWIAEIRGKGKEAASTRTYTYKASTLPSSAGHENVDKNKDKKKKEKNKDSSSGKSTVQIEEEPVDPRVVALKHAFERRGSVANNVKGKKKELSPQDAAMMIQINFRAYLIRRSQALRALRELALAKAKLKELRILFNNFSYRHRIVRDGEERQKFSEKIIILLLTVDAIEGADLMVRAARRSMVDELEAMLEVVDPQPPGKLGSMKRRRFDLPEGGFQKEIAEGVAEVVHMLNQEERNGGTFEVCL